MGGALGSMIGDNEGSVVLSLGSAVGSPLSKMVGVELGLSLGGVVG